MSLIVPKYTAVTFMTGFNTSTIRYEAGVHCNLPGADPYDAVFQCDPRVPEEMAAFYDDLMHDSAIWLGLFQSALTDVCTFQAPLL